MGACPARRETRADEPLQFSLHREPVCHDLGSSQDWSCGDHRIVLNHSMISVASSPPSVTLGHMAHCYTVATCSYRRNTWHRLPIASKTHVLSIGTYCFVTILIISWATMPPVAAEVL